MFDSAIVVGDSDFVSLFNDLKQGGYVAVFAEPTRYPRVGLMVEDAGFEVRDSLHVALGSGPTGQAEGHWVGMLARKPFIGTVVQNILTHGVGGLNIDECRIGSGSDNLNGGAYAKSCEDRDDGWRYQRGGAGNYKQPAGRWPANSVLVHSMDCLLSRVVNDTLGEGSQASSGLVGVTAQPVTWECADRCPVKVLNGQSGKSKAGKPSDVRGKGGIWAEGDGVPCGPQYGDVGGAGRYFMNLTWSLKDTGSLPASLLDYIQRLVTPTSGKCLMAL